MYRSEVRVKIADELARGEQARGDGFEGRARVCARRAAGIAVREYLEQVGVPPSSIGPSAVDLLAYLQTLPEMGAEMQLVLEHLLARVNSDFLLPFEGDLLAEARWLAAELESRLPRD